MKGTVLNGAAQRNKVQTLKLAFVKKSSTSLNLNSSEHVWLYFSV